MAKKKRKVWIWIVLLIVVAALAGGYLWFRNLSSRMTVIEYKTYTVNRGTVVRSITSSGRLSAGGDEAVKAESGIKIKTVYYKEGDAVQSGDVLASYDPDSIRDRIDALYDEIASLDAQIRRRSSRDTITSPTSGRVKEIYAKEGDDLEMVMRKYGALALISSDDKMQVIIQSGTPLSIGKAVTVQYEGQKKSGTVANILPEGYLITLPDNRIEIGTAAEVYDKDTKLGEGTLEIHSPIYVYATNGIVSAVNVSVNGTVNAGGKLFTLADKPDSAAYTSAVQDRTEKAEKIAELYALLEEPSLKSPADGVIASVGATEDAAVNGDAFVLHTGGAVKMPIAVDEIDIGVVSAGQNASVTLDAFAGEVFSAEVTHISHIGTPSGSITTYAVELTLQADERLLEGMNGSATVVAQQKENVLLIPVEAIFEDTTGVYVYVQVADGTERRDIVTGLSDGTYAEIVSGLKEGDVVQYQGSYISLIEQYRQMSVAGRGAN